MYTFMYIYNITVLYIYTFMYIYIYSYTVILYYTHRRLELVGNYINLYHPFLRAAHNRGT
jgi:hypothetical protein